MAKKYEQNIITKVGNEVTLEHSSASDDSLIPSPQELLNYKAVDENIVPWILQHTSEEQKFRHESDFHKTKMVKMSLINDRIIVVSFFLLILVFLLLSAGLIVMEKDVEGSIFGIAGLVAAFFMFKRLL